LVSKVRQGLTGSEHTFERIGYFERLLSGNAKDQFCKTYTLVSKMMLIKWDINVDDPEQFKRLSANRTLFAEWVFEDEELSQYELTLPVAEQKALTEKLTKGSESAEEFEKLLWFELGKLIWKDHRQVYYEHILSTSNRTSSNHSNGRWFNTSVAFAKCSTTACTSSPIR
jgi:hypothetical protein